MKLTSKILLFLLIVAVTITSCKKDDDEGDIIVPARDRAEEAIVAKAEIEAFLQTHFYNYEDFENPPVGFNFKILFDTIAGVNSDKIPLIDQVTSKTVVDRIKPEVSYTLYYLNAIQGEGVSPIFADAALLSYKGTLLKDNITFDASETPVSLDLTQTIIGFQEAVIEFNASTGFVENPDGTISFENYGVGAVFIPSGLGYFSAPPITSIIGFYEQIVFTFQLFDVTKNIDHDEDGIPSFMEDLNNNGILNDDDTDGDGVPNYLDRDDDGDGVLTKDEIIINEDGSVTFPDSNGNGTPDYLDSTYPNN